MLTPGCLKVTDACFSVEFFNSGGIVLFAFTNQANVLPVYQELVNPVKRRLMKIIRNTILLVVILYLIMGNAGYFSTLNNTTEIVLTRPPPTTSWSTDWFMTFCAVLVLSTMCCNILTNYMPFRNSLYFMITGREDFSSKFNWVCTYCFQFGVALCSILFPSVSNVLAIFGGITSTNIVYIVPRKCPFLLSSLFKRPMLAL